MVRNTSKSIALTPDIYNKLRSRGHYGQSMNGIIAELLDNSTCKLCGKPMGDVHDKCADRESNK